VDADSVSISVVIPVHDGASFLADALRSVHAQSCPVLECLVVDDGSRDGSAAVAAGLGARVITTDHCGISHARNVGVAAACGEWIAFLDADDMWTDDSLAARMSHVAEHQELDYVYGLMTDFVDPDDPPPPWVPRARVDERVGMMSTFVVRADVLARTGPFDESLSIGEDIEWLARATDAGARSACLEAVLARHRLHGHSATVRDASMGRAALTRIVRESVQRKRTGAT